MDEEVLDKLTSEIRRGAIVLGVLGELRREHYGYSLRKNLAAKGLNIEEGTLYPLIRRLEKQGLLVSQWREEAKRKKRFYKLSDHGVEVFAQLLANWEELGASIDTLTRGET